MKAQIYEVRVSSSGKHLTQLERKLKERKDPSLEEHLRKLRAAWKKNQAAA